MKYTIFNIDAGKTLKNDLSEAEFTHFIRNLAIENGDEDLSITTKGEAIDYLNEYCGNLELSIVDEEAVKSGVNTNCPKCGSENITAFDFDGETSSQEVECDDCGCIWDEHYSFTSLTIKN